MRHQTHFLPGKTFNLTSALQILLIIITPLVTLGLAPAKLTPIVADAPAIEIAISPEWLAQVQENIQPNIQGVSGEAIASEQSPSSLSSPYEDPEWENFGEATSHQFGYSVATAGDVNGDGYSDVIVGAPFYGTTTPGEGKVYVYYGGPGGLPASPSWTAESNQAGAHMGSSVATAGDVNGDGYSDIIVGVPDYYSSNPLTNGLVLIWHGGIGGLGPNGTIENADWRTYCTECLESDNFGNVVATAGDVNSDGISDVIVGDPNYDNLGRTDNGRVALY
jgi:hypothetical protein